MVFFSWLFWWIFPDKLCPYPVSSRLVYQYFPRSSTQSAQTLFMCFTCENIHVWSGMKSDHSAVEQSTTASSLSCFPSRVHNFIVGSSGCVGWSANCPLPLDSLARATTDICVCNKLAMVLNKGGTLCSGHASSCLQKPGSRWQGQLQNEKRDAPVL